MTFRPMVLGLAVALLGCAGEEGDPSPATGSQFGTNRVVELERSGPDEEPARPSLDDGHVTGELAPRRRLGDDRSFGRVVELLAFDSILVVADVKLPPLVKVVHLGRAAVVHEFGKAGEGPGEFVSPRALNRLGSKPPKFQVYDFQNQRLSTYSWDRATRDVRAVDHTRFVGGLPVENPIRLPASSRYLASGLFTEYSLVLTDSTGRVVRGLDSPLPVRRDEPRASREANLRHFTSDPAGSRFVLAWQHANRLDLVQGPDGPYTTVKGPREVTVEYDRSASSFRLTGDGELGYVDVYATKRNIYALLCDCTRSDATPHGRSHLPRLIHVFGWDGEYRGEIRLDREVLQIAVSPHDTRLFAFYRNPVPSVGEWELPAWTRDSACPVDTVWAEERMRIGRLEGPEPYVFGDVNSVAADAENRIYVADRFGSSVRAFGPDGRFLAWIAREGAGPGEVRWPTDLLFGPDGELYMRDRSRVTVLVPSEPGGLADSVRATWPAPVMATSRTERSRLDGEGRYLYPHELHPRGGPSRYFYLAQSGTGEVEDTLPVPSYEGLGRADRAHYMISAGTGRMVEGLSAAPFESKPTWSLTPRATVLGGQGADYVLVETDGRGDTVRRIGIPGTGRRPVPEGERRDSLEALEARIDSLPVPLSKVEGVSPAARDRDLPQSLPAYTSVHVDGAGRAWVRRWPPAGEAGRTYFDVLGPEGACLGLVVLPEDVASRPPPFFGPERILGVVEDPVTEVERVVGFSYRLGDEGR